MMGWAAASGLQERCLDNDAIPRVVLPTETQITAGMRSVQGSLSIPPHTSGLQAASPSLLSGL
jgi:hypothetical protein